MQIEEKPSWKAGVTKPEFPKLNQDIEADVAVVGGGLAGVLTAYQLTRAGKKVVLLEKKKIGSGATEYTTAFITQAIDTDLPELIKLFGENSARQVWQSGGEAIDLIEKIVQEEKIDCEFMRTDVNVFASGPEQYQDLEEERNTVSNFGFDVSPISQYGDYKFTNFGCYKINNQAKFHPLKFLFQLAQICSEQGVQIFQETEVTKIKHSKSSVIVEAGDRKITAKDVVIATYQPFNKRIRMFLKRGMYKSYVFEVQLPKNIIPEGLYWDLENPYNYFRIDAQEQFDRMILGGQDIKSIIKMSDDKNFAALEEYLEKLLPDQKYSIVRRWVGPILEPSDGLPLIGEVSASEYIASAFSGNGMTYSAISAMILTDLILNKQNVYAKVYDPKRIPSLRQLFIKGSDYVEEFIEGAAKNIFKKEQSAGN
ncbi:MAG: FAD-binding oxidoreductase [Candidatus Doudnabacteria bacterium]|nr:FAD-binding oxidoreductase [Candidatus Doudnabacteria bacterium]